MSKKQHVEEVEEEEVAPFWMISFSDMMTLLLSFFIMLFSMSTIEVEKLSAVAESMGNRFGGQGAGTLLKHRILNQKMPSGRNAIPMTKPSTVPELHLLADEQVTGGIILFDPGIDRLDDRAREQVKAIREQIEGTHDKMMICGHASQNELASTVYRNADDLAYARAWNVREYLVSLGMKQQDFLLSQFGSVLPMQQTDFVTGSAGTDTNAYVRIVLVPGLPKTSEWSTP